MFKKSLLFIALMALFAPLASIGQEAVLVNGTHPYSDGFEGSTCEWEFVNGESTNAWCWGTATSNGGSHSVYISTNGGSYTYNTSTATWVYFTKRFTFESGSYDFAYDWKCYGENNCDYIRVGLVPDTTELVYNEGIPSSWVSLDDDTKLCYNSYWSTKYAHADVTEGTYKMVFAWRNDNSSGSNPPGAIDNVGIRKFMAGYTYLTQTNTNDFIKGSLSNVSIANNNIALQYKMASVADWSATTNLPQTLKDHQVATWRNYVYCVGGYNGTNPVSNVYRATQQDNGISGWTELAALPVALKDMAVIATQNQLVIIGGRNNDTVSDKIYSATLNDNGSLGEWEELSVSLPQPCWGARVVEALGNLFIIGGANTDTENDATDKVYRLTLNAVGEVTGIAEVTSLPEARNGHAATVYDSKIIVTGGYDASFTSKNTVYTVAINLDGSLGTWQTNTVLPNAVYGHTTVCTNGILTVIGGKEGSLESNKFFYTDADATAYNWQLSDILLPERYTQGASFLYDNKIFYCGGINLSGNLNNAVRFMTVNPSTTPAGHPVFISWPFYVGTPKQMVELNYNLINTASYTYEMLYRTAGEDLVFGNWTSGGTNLPVTVNQTKKYIQYMFRITATGDENFTVEDVTLTLSGYTQLAGNLWMTNLTAENSPYLVTETISFTSGTHNIGPGVTIMFMPNTGLNIGQASVNFNGNEESPILLTAYEAGIGCWNGVYYQNASDNNGLTSVMNYTTIEKAGNGDNHANLRMDNTNQPSLINHCSFNESSSDGLWCYRSSSSPTLTDCTFNGNGSAGLNIDCSSLSCTSCTMNNNQYGLYLYGSYNYSSTASVTDCTMTGNSFAGIDLSSNYTNATFTGVTCSNNQYGYYSYSPNKSFNFDESIITFADNTADIAVGSGTIDSDQTWNYYANGYVLLGDVTIYNPNGGNFSPKLTIAAGNTIKVQSGCYINVGITDNSASYYGGQLYAVGTAEAPITFTSLNGEAGGWRGLRFRNTSDNNSSSSLRYCVVENATTNLYCELTNQPSVMWCTFQNSTGHNVDLYKQANISIESCTVKNAPRGLVVNNNTNPIVVDVVFENLSEACVRHYSTGCNITYYGCTMKDSQAGICLYTPDTDIPEVSNITFENVVCNFAVPEGTINNSHTWAANSYSILGTVNIYGSTLTLSPGSVLKFAEGKQLSVDYYGSLVAEGTAEQPVTFTSMNGEVGGWNGIYFKDYSDYSSEQQSSLKHCIVENGNEYNLYMYRTAQPFLVENCTFRNSAAKGVDLYDSYNTFANCTFENNAGYPIYYNNGHYVGVLDNLTFTGNLLDGVVVNGGNIATTRTWSANTYYILNNTLFVGGNGNYNTYHYGLTLQPGTTLKFDEGIWMSIGETYSYYGDLHAEGTAEQPIIFTSINGEPGGWNGLYFGNYTDSYAEQGSTMKHCIVENGNAYNMKMNATNQPSLIENCVFQNSNGYGLYFTDYSSPVVSKSTIKDNASHGIFLTYHANPTIGGSPETANNIYNNSGYAVYMDDYYMSSNLNMTHNFWGNIGSQIIDDNMIYDKLDNASLGRVLFEPVSWFPMDNFGHLQGTCTYNNDDAKLMANCEMNIINENDSIMATATTNGSGVFDFSNYAVGVYNTMNPNMNVDIVAGVNATDALLVMRHFVHLDTLTGNYAAIADVNGSNNINGTDAMLIMRRAIDETFPVGDFYFFNPNGISIEGNTCTYDLSFLCYGDVNGSYNLQTRDNTIELITEGQLLAASYQEMEIPVSIKTVAEMGALTLRFNYPEEYLEIEDVILAATGESLLFAANEGELKTVWYSLEPMTLAENDGLILIKVHTKDLSNLDAPVAFSLIASSEMADGTAQVLDGVLIAMPELVTLTLGMNDNMIDDVRLSVYPNPANEVCRLSYQLSEAGRVTVSVYNMMGVKVMDVANFRQEEGKHELQLATSSLAAGMYCCRITFEGESSWVKNVMLTIEK